MQLSIISTLAALIHLQQLSPLGSPQSSFARPVQAKLPRLCPMPARLDNVLQIRRQAGPARTAAWETRSGLSVVNRDGVGCAVVFSGNTAAQEWPGSRVIAAVKGQHRQRPQQSRLRTFHRQRFRRFTTRARASIALPPARRQIPRLSSAIRPPLALPTIPWSAKPVGGVIVFAGGLASL